MLFEALFDYAIPVQLLWISDADCFSPWRPQSLRIVSSTWGCHESKPRWSAGTLSDDMWWHKPREMSMFTGYQPAITFIYSWTHVHCPKVRITFGPKSTRCLFDSMGKLVSCIHEDWCSYLQPIWLYRKVKIGIDIHCLPRIHVYTSGH